MTMPNFLIIGAQKSGTTSLNAYLAQHPQIYMCPLKEPRFFAFEGEKPDFRGPGDQEQYESIVGDIEVYRTLFAGVSKEKAIGEASVLYLYISSAPERIRHYIPEVKVIAILRNPVERAYSAFLHLTRDRKEPLRDFARALQAEEERIGNNWGPIWHYKQVGFYYVQLKRYFETFERDQIRVYLHEDLKNDPIELLKDIFRFLSVEDAFVPEVSRRYNVSGVPTNEGWYALLLRQNLAKSIVKPLLPRGLRRHVSTTLLRNRTLVKPPLPTEVQQQLTELYREDILKLQELIGRDLSQWLR